MRKKMDFFKKAYDLSENVGNTLVLTIAIVVILIILGGGLFVFKFFHDLIIEPIKSGNITMISFIIILVFFVLVYKRLVSPKSWRY